MKSMMIVVFFCAAVMDPTPWLYADLPKAGAVKLFIYNVLRQKVSTVYEGNLKAGQHIMTWNGKDIKRI